MVIPLFYCPPANFSARQAAASHLRRGFCGQVRRLAADQWRFRFSDFVQETQQLRKSKYYNLDSVPTKWKREDFIFAILTLESLDLNQLTKLLEAFDIYFTGGPPIDDEEAIGALLSDVPPEKLLSHLRELKK